ncbi:MAG: protein phosphatase 2C domain-containing protein [Bifidobacteriaceae bacterium]|nr:protein phosphatase 2C domain-containing protein [Bifidobacteriaceae bacterium]
MTLSFAARSDIGLTRSNNQDSGYAGPHLLMVADGMGGHAGGDIASSVAVAHLALLDEEAPSTQAASEAINQAVDLAHAELLDRVAEQPELAGLGTTITALLRCEDRLVLAHIGDSRAYLLRDQHLEQVTTDHTFVQYLVETGKLEPDQAERHPQRSLLLRVLGDVELSGGVDISVRSTQAGDRWLVCSDGLSSVVSAQTLQSTLSQDAEVGEIAEQLIDLALRAGGPDNVTCVVAKVVDLDDLPDGQAPPTNAEIVGAAAVDRERPTRGGSGAAAKAARLTQPEPADSEPEPAVLTRRQLRRAAKQRSSAGLAASSDDLPDAESTVVSRPHRWRRRLIWSAIAIVLVFGGAFGLSAGYRWSQSQFYVGQADGQVSIFQGINQQIGPIKLSHLVERTRWRVADLPTVAQERLYKTIPAASREEAAEKLARFILNVDSSSMELGNDQPTSQGTN